MNIQIDRQINIFVKRYTDGQIYNYRLDIQMDRFIHRKMIDNSCQMTVR